MFSKRDEEEQKVMSDSSTRERFEGSKDVGSSQTNKMESQEHPASVTQLSTKASLLLTFPQNELHTTANDDSRKTQPPLGPPKGKSDPQARKFQMFDEILTSLCSSPASSSTEAGAKNEEEGLENGGDENTVVAEHGLVDTHAVFPRTKVAAQESSEQGDKRGGPEMVLEPYVQPGSFVIDVVPQNTKLSLVSEKNFSVGPAYNRATGVFVREDHVEKDRVSIECIDGGRFGNRHNQWDDVHNEDRNLDTHKRHNGLFEHFYEWWKEADKHRVVMLAATSTAFVLTVIALPLSQLDVVNGACYTYWGYKENCDAHIYNNRTDFITCSPIRNSLHVGAAFSSMTVIFLFAALCCCMLLLRGKNISKPEFRLAIIVLLSTAFLLQCVSWSAIANLFVSRYCEDELLSRTTAYGVAFGMSVTSWLILAGGVLASFLSNPN